MIVLGIDPGAKRCGYAVLRSEEDEQDFRYMGSGVLGVEREKEEAFQEYRLRLVKFWAIETEYLLRAFHPDIVVSETVPAASATSFGLAGDPYLAHAQISAVHAIAYDKDVPVMQMSAATAKKAVTGNGKATKAKVRDGVLSHMPMLEYKRQEWRAAKTWDESDGLCIALAYLLKQRKGKKVGRKEG